jgi:hypothetical protein
MTKLEAIRKLQALSRQGRTVFLLRDLQKIFPDDSPVALKAGLKRLIDEEILCRPVKGVYVNIFSPKDSYLLERVVKAMRRGEYNYVSLESALSAYGIISQIPVDRLTVMTTGRGGEYPTPWGTIELTHTNRGILDILDATIETQSPLKQATPATAIRDLRRVGRNTHLMDLKEE